MAYSLPEHKEDRRASVSRNRSDRLPRPELRFSRLTPSLTSPSSLPASSLPLS